MRSAALVIAGRKNKNRLSDRGMALIHMGAVLLIGVGMPLFIENPASQLFFIAALPVLILNQWAAESIAAEKQSRTIESLISTRIPTKSLLLGSMLHALSGGAFFFTVTLLLSVLTRALIKVPFALDLPGLAGYVACVVCLMMLVAVFGVRASALSEDPQKADMRASFLAYPALVVLLLAVTIGGLYPRAILILYVGYAAFLLVAAILVFTISRSIPRSRLLGHAQYHSRQARPAEATEQNGGRSAARPVGNFRCVLRHEIRYMRAINRYKHSFVLFCIAPAIFLVLAQYFGLPNGLYIPIAILLFAAPRLPINIAGFSVAGERAYKTGESLLSTPISTGAAFLGKTILPAIVSAAIIVLSSLLTLITARIASGLGATLPVGYTADQFIMIFVTGPLISIFSIFLTVLCTMLARQTRQGYLIASLIGNFIMLPVLALLLAVNDKMLWAIVVSAALLGINIALGAVVAKGLRRDVVMKLVSQ